MKKYIPALFLSIIFIYPAHALDIDYISSFLNSDSHVLEKEIRNASNDEHHVNIKIERISSPLKEGKVIPMNKPGELLLTPENVILSANTNQIIYFTYKGKEDDKERYYRIIWLDREIPNTQQNDSIPRVKIKIPNKIGTLLVVAPRQVKYSHKYNDGEIVNTGNATFKVLAYGPCLKSISNTDCRENYFLTPGRKIEFSRVDMADKNSHISLWQGKQFVSVK